MLLGDAQQFCCGFDWNFCWRNRTKTANIVYKIQFVKRDEISVHGLQSYHTKPNHILMEMLVVLLLLNGGKGLFFYLLAHLSI